MKSLKSLAVALLIAAQPVLADSPQTGIVVSGQGQVAVLPDLAVASFGVRQRADTAQEAMQQVSAVQAAVLDALGDVGVADRDRQTSGFYLRPVYNDRGVTHGSAPDLVGYEAGNTVTVRFRDLALLGPALDRMVAVGANDFNGLRFDLQDPAAARSAARALAVRDAMTRAAELAAAAGVTLGPLQQLSEQSYNARPEMMQMAGGRAAMSDAIAAGELSVEVQVNAVFAIAGAE